MHAPHVKGVVGVGNHVTEPGRAHEMIRQLAVNHAGCAEPLERVGIAGGRSELQRKARGHLNVDHNLGGLPQVKDHGVGGVSGGLQLSRRGG